MRLLVLLLLAASAAAAQQNPAEILRRAAQVYRSSHSFEVAGELRTRMTSSSAAYDLAWPVSVAQADSKALPPQSPVPALPALIGFGRKQFRDSAGGVVHPSEEGPPSPNGWPVFDQIDEAVSEIRGLSRETIKVDGKATACWVLEVSYERGFPTRALSGRPVRYWIDASSFLVVRQAFALRDGAGDELREWVFEATSTRINEPPPAWAVRALPQLAGTEREDWAGRAAPQFTLLDFDGRQVGLDGLRGKAVLLSFWATWCAPCKDEIPVFEKLRGEFGPRGLVVWGINNESAGKAREWLDRYSFDFPTLADKNRVAFRAYEADKIPVSVVVDRSGMVVSYLEGLGSEAYFRAAIERALGDLGDEP